MPEKKEFADVSMEIPKGAIPQLTLSDLDMDGVDEDAGLPLYNPEKPSELLKNEDPQSVRPFVGAEYEVLQFDLWKEGEIKAYQEKLTEVGTDPNSYITFHDRISDKDHGSWSVLLEIAHRVRVKR